MRTSMFSVRLSVCALLALLVSSTNLFAQHRLCDPGGEDCRQILIDHIRAEQVGLDVAFWFMEDWWIANEVINRHKAGVPVRVLMDTRANVPNPLNATRLAELEAAGIPMRERVVSGILHWKMMLFAGQDIVQFSAANYSPDAWVYSGEPYSNYTDEVILFTSDTPIVNSFRTKYDDLWTDTGSYRDYANVVARQRVYDTFPLDPRLNFVPSESHAVRAVQAFGQEPLQIDVVMYRITDSRYADAMIAAVRRGVKVRLLTEPKQYRDPIRQYHSYNVDRMYMAGVEIRHRGHAGLNHQKSVLLRGLGQAIFGSSNWSSASSESQEEHNLFTDDPTIYDWLTAQFERKWNNLAPVAESAPFVPQPPDVPTSPSPASGSTGSDAVGLTLSWYPGLWAHTYDVYLGTDPFNLPRIAADLPLGPARFTGDMKSHTVEGLLPGTTYYWRVDGKTMADQVASSSLWSFKTAGTAPPPPSATLVRGPYLQQVTATSAIVVWATREAGAAQVRLTPPAGPTTTVAATSVLYPAAATQLAQDYYQHAAVLNDLQPATTYTYDILLAGVDLNPALDALTTAPSRGTGQVSFVAFGDSGTGSAAQQQIAALLGADAFDFAMHAGDIAYGNTSGTGGATYQTMDDWFFGMYGFLRAKAMFPSIGNHDSRAANSDGRPYLDLFVLPPVGGSGGYADHAERYYSFDYGPVHVIVLDTELAFQDEGRRAAQLAWVEADLAATTQPWKIAIYHRSPYSSGGEHGSDLAVRAAFAPLFDRYEVQLSLSAHEHDYERTVPLRGGVQDANGTVYVVTGGGGAPLYSAASDTWTAHSASVYHYVRGTATECTLQLDAVGLDGASFDTVTLRRCLPPVDSEPPQVAILRPAEGATVAGVVTVAVSATDNVGVDRVEFLVGGTVVMTDASAPFSFAWDSTAVANGVSELKVRAIDAAGNATVSAAVQVDVQNLALGEGDILLYAADAAVVVGRWQKEADSTAAGGFKLRNPDAGAAKRATPAANPADYFELTFTAVPDVPYRFYMRGKADGNYWPNDSVFVQFTGTDDYRIGTTRAIEYNLEDCSGCRVSEWGWQDNAWGVGVPSEPIVFTTPGPHTMRVQVREDGLSIDQILFSPAKFFTTWPGRLQNDTNIYPRSSGDADPPPADTTAPTASISTPVSGASVTGTVQVAVSASDNVGVTRVELLVDGAVLAQTTTAPYQFAWDTSAHTAGSHSLNARAFDAAGNAGLSSSVTVTITSSPPPPNSPPSVQLTSPTAGFSATAPATIALSASASDTDGTITRVDFYAGATAVASATTSPYSATWAGVPAGTYSLTAVATDDDGAKTTSAAVSITVTTASPAPGLPAPWTAQDIGTVGAAGSATATNGVFTVKGGGADIWGGADAFLYVWQPLTGDADVVARVSSVEYVDRWVKAGVMIRETLTAGSAHALMLVSPGKGLAFQRRPATGGTSVSTSGGAGTAPVWVKLERRANTITAYRSADGVSWTLVGSQSFVMANSVHVGLAVTSHTYGTLATATFDNVSVTPVATDPGEPPNVAPVVELTSPVSGASFTAPATISLAASASDEDGTVTRVDFYADTTRVGSVTAEPFAVAWQNVPAGTYTITARAFDDDGGVTASDGASITVTAPPPTLPVEWTGQDIGAVGVPGVADESDGVFTITAEGQDIWNTADAFHYVWQPLSGDADIIARVTYVENVHAWVKAGVMVREQLTADSAHALMLVSPGKGLAFQRRTSAGATSVHTSGGSGTAPQWVKLERRGSVITAYRSADGVTWTLVGSETFAMPNSVHVGLVVSSHVNGRLATATFDNVAVVAR